jgi:hypothetical protein
MDDTIKKLASLTGRQRVILVFNKASGEPLAQFPWMDPATLSGQELYIYEEGQFDLLEDEVEGTYPDYVIKNKLEGPQKVYEAQLDTQVAYKITKAYPVAEQVNIVGRAVQLLAKEHGIELPELAELLDFIAEVKQLNKVQKEHYIESPDYIYITNAESEEAAARRYAGGVHESLGPRTIEGGRVFG